MGILRVYLALCVIAAHAGLVLPWQMHDGREAVEMFYMISGFYMAMVLSSKYSAPKDFYLSRVLRIYPPYWVVLLATILVSAMTGVFFHQWLFLKVYINHPLGRNGAAGFLLAAVSNFTLIGQDWVMFLRDNTGQPIQFTRDFRNGTHPLWEFLLVPQCWTVSLELTFYAIVPYLNRLRTRWLVLLTLGTIAMRLFAYRGLGLAHDPWDYRFFPFELTLFLFGMLGYRLYAGTKAHHPPQRYRCASNFSYVIGAAVLLLLLYLHVRLVGYLGRFTGDELSSIATYPLAILGIPVLFFVFGNQKVDRYIGELSYPIYLVNSLVIFVISVVMRHVGFQNWLGVASALASVGAAAIFYQAFILPLDKQRHFLTGKQQPRAEQRAEVTGATQIHVPDAGPRA